jgi:hypothetical protein
VRFHEAGRRRDPGGARRSDGVTVPSEMAAMSDEPSTHDPDDVICRGGHEFVCSLTGQDADGAIPRLHAL